jgi:hypothetical protein
MIARFPYYYENQTMKFRRKSKKTDLSKKLSHHSRKTLSNRDLSIKINEVKNSKKKFRFAFIKKLTWHKKKDTSMIKLPLITPLSSPPIAELENEFIFMLKKIYNKSETQNCQQEKHSTLVDPFNLNNSLKETMGECNQYQTKFHAGKRLLITRSVHDFARTSKKRYLYSSLSSQPVHQSLLKNVARRASHSDTSLNTIPRYRIKETIDSLIKPSSESINNKKSLACKISIKSESCLKKQNFPTNRKLSLHWNEDSLKSTSKQYQSQDAAIIEFEHQSYLSFSKTLEKSHSSPLPINKNHSSIINNHIQNAHIIHQYPYENKNKISLYACASEIGNDQSTESISSDDENVERRLLQYHENINKKNLRHRWSLLDIWQTTMAKLPPILNCVWRKRLHRTGSREFREFLFIRRRLKTIVFAVLEYDQTLPTNHNNNRENFVQEQRYVEQERPINSYIGLALLAFLVFPPVGK